MGKETAKLVQTQAVVQQMYARICEQTGITPAMYSRTGRATSDMHMQLAALTRPVPEDTQPRNRLMVQNKNRISTMNNTKTVVSHLISLTV